MGRHLALAALLAACSPKLDDPCVDDQACPHGQTCQEGYCFPAPADAAPSGTDAGLVGPDASATAPDAAAPVADGAVLADAEVGADGASVAADGGAEPDQAVAPLAAPVLDPLRADHSTLDSRLEVRGSAPGATRVQLFRDAACQVPEGRTLAVLDGVFSGWVEDIEWDEVVQVTAIASHDEVTSGCSAPLVYERNAPPELEDREVRCLPGAPFDASLRVDDTPADLPGLGLALADVGCVMVVDVAPDRPTLSGICPEVDCDLRLSVTDGLATGYGAVRVRPVDPPPSVRATARSVPTLTALDQIALVDVDGDGRLDIVGVDRVALTIRRADQGFASPERVALDGLPQGRRFAAADVDRDGIPEIVVASAEGQVRWYRRGAGGYVAAEGFMVPRERGRVGAGAVALGDLDGDGRVDLAVALPEGERVLVVTGAGASLVVGLEGAPTDVRVVTVRPGSAPELVVLLDDEDGDLQRLRIDERGRLAADDAIDLGAGVPFALATRDAEGDAPAVASVAFRGPGAVVVVGLVEDPAGYDWGQDEDGVVLPGPVTRWATPGPPGGAAIGDFNGDGFQDVAAGLGGAASEVRYWLIVEGGQAEESAASAAPSGPPVAADLNGDGIDDLVIPTDGPALLLRLSDR